MTETVDVAIVGAGAAGLMTAIRAGEPAGGPVVLLDGARRLGAKILIAGGGRCNVTHREVRPTDFHGSSRNAIGKVLRRLDVARTRAFFEELGVPLVEEPTGKLFPEANRARVVLEALLGAAEHAGAELRHPWRVESVARTGDGFRLSGPQGELRARRVVLATGGRSIPKTGSDGAGYGIARSLGIEVTERIFPALAPLLLADGHPLRELAGVSAPARLTLRSRTGKRIVSVEGSTLCTHFGLSGPAPLDLSRHVTAARFDDPEAAVEVDWRPGTSEAEADEAFRTLGRRTVLAELRRELPERLARALAEMAGVPPDRIGAELRRDERRALVRTLVALPLPITGDRGFGFAEATAGGVPLSALRLESMEAREAPGVHVVGEICDVDGRIGGFNFQWAWSSGHAAGRALARVNG